MEVFAGEKSFQQFQDWLPQETIDAMQEFRVSIKGPLTTPVGGGIRSLNVTLRQVLDLYACIRPVRYFEGVGAPVKEPEKVNIVIFRENTEDVYAGIEWKAGSPEAEKLAAFLRKEFKSEIREKSALGVKPMSEFGSKRLVEMAIRYAIAKSRESVTLVHKGNIMKFTEGAFRDWGYEVARDKFPDDTCTEAGLAKGGPTARADAVVMRDRIADSMFQQLLLRPSEYSVIATPNLNGDYLSDAAAAQVGGLGIAPGRQRRRRSGRIRSNPRHGAEIRQSRQDQSRQRHSVGRDDVRVHGLERSGRADHQGSGERHQIEARHVRSRAADARLD